ncbi:MAG TPA: ATP-binding cassette domain-containing protein, partial [Deltaproteobacteria bacterium]|nr:ATP-binding cassette domain-containing protein [Deltaproteobacteria bacterium]
MDNDIAISVKNLSKKYRLYDSPKHRLKEALHPFRKSYHRDFWVLRNINLDIPRGSTFGIVGQNGSGKSTLLQVICGILQPTEGNVQTNGRISALLELGSGFNKAFTGRENVYMQGAIMGIER